MIEARGVDVEIVELRSGDDPLNVTVPTLIRINGQEVLVPEDVQISISDITGRDFVTVTLTMIVGSLTIKSENDAA